MGNDGVRHVFYKFSRESSKFILNCGENLPNLGFSGKSVNVIPKLRSEVNSSDDMDFDIWTKLMMEDFENTDLFVKVKFRGKSKEKGIHNYRQQASNSPTFNRIYQTFHDHRRCR